MLVFSDKRLDIHRRSSSMINEIVMSGGGGVAKGILARPSPIVEGPGGISVRLENHGLGMTRKRTRSNALEMV